jgi:peroxiredoxin
MKNKAFAPLCRSLLALLFVGLFAGSVHAATKMPSFSLPDAQNGKDVSSEGFTGKVLLVTFFATWMQEVPTLIELQKEYGENGFSVLALSVDQGGPSVVAKLIQKRGINYPVLMADSQVSRDFGGVVGVPTSFLINKTGNVVKKYPGYVPHAVLENDIKKIMN